MTTSEHRELQEMLSEFTKNAKTFTEQKNYEALSKRADLMLMESECHDRTNWDRHEFMRANAKQKLG
ncbi:hypothetical protein AAG747_15325 [Rapidithrix thailandica]|uniref:Uncharacterized protein n=1 Tax=Rapidithrix thailandica TaxID=413964 RepID=A0AAW9S8K2_9BACT